MRSSQLVFKTALIIFITLMGFIACSAFTNEQPGISLFDFNGDGFNDLLVGALGDDDGGSDSGCVFIFFGNAVLPSSIDASKAEVKLIGENANDHFGWSVSNAGDVNNDGFDDVIVGAKFDDDGGYGSGCAFIFFGSSNPSSIINASNADVKIIGEGTGDHLGSSVSYASDMNNDGYDDVIVGAEFDDDGGDNAGCAYIFFGSSNLPSTIDASNADVKIIGEDAHASFGYSISTAGDVNNDGFVDVIVGATGDRAGGDWSGSTYIFFGSANIASSIDASNADVKLIGGDANDYFGCSVSTAGDVNNDGYDDVIVGALYDDDNGDKSGCAFIFYGSSNPSSSIDASNADVKFIGTTINTQFGISVSNAGDVNNDGFDDVIVGANLDDDGGIDSGCAFIFFGNTNLSSVIHAINADVILIGEDAGDHFGKSVSTAGDVDNDGFEDVIVGANFDDDGAICSGCAFIFFGNSNPSSTIDASNADAKLIGENIADEFGTSVSGGN